MSEDNKEELMKLANQVSRSTVAVVDAVTQRGGFKGEELSTIGQLRDQAIQMISLVETMQQEAAMEDDEEYSFTFIEIHCIIMFCYEVCECLMNFCGWRSTAHVP